MVINRNPVHINDAVETVVNHTIQLNTVTVAYTDALGHILAEDLVASVDVPIFNKSAMDGFAIRAQDSVHATGDNRVEFTVVETIPAGSTSDYKLEENEAFRIMTGAEIPNSADTVVMFEQTKETENGFTIRRAFDIGENIAFQGEECQKGDIIVPKGTLINPGTIATLATFGYSEIDVYQRPNVGILSTGSELLSVEDALERGKIRNSNTPMIKAQLERIGIKAKEFHFTSDDINQLMNAFNNMLNEVDIVITTGGVSVGDYDLLPKVYEKLEAKVLFNKVAMRPGSVTTVARFGDKLLFGLSGNPSACYSGFELFVRPSIQVMQGNTRPFTPVVEATLSADFKKPNPFTRFIRADIEYQSNGISAVPSGFNKSNAVTSIAKSNGVIILPSGSRGYSKGDLIRVMLTDVTSGSDHFKL